jgi:hypothetical protein
VARAEDAARSGEAYRDFFRFSTGTADLRLASNAFRAAAALAESYDSVTCSGADAAGGTGPFLIALLRRHTVVQTA